MIKPVELFRDVIKIIDQTALPDLVRFEYIYNLEQACEAIKKLKVRGAPLIGIFAAYTVVQIAREVKDKRLERIKEILKSSVKELSKTRPTAYNLFFALDRMTKIIDEAQTKDELLKNLEDEAKRIDDEEKVRCENMASHGIKFLKEKSRVLTICNTGYLATNHIGTALGVIYKGVKKGKIEKVFALETRPLLQGARLTMWELKENAINATLITDSTAGLLMARGMIDAIFVGADRIAANGDTANKIGTYTLAVLAKHHNVPFYVVAPSSTIDPSTLSGKDIIIEKREPSEVLEIMGKRIAPEGVDALNYAFDVTPYELITAIITEEGVVKPPFR